MTRIAEIQFIDAVDGKIRTVGEVIEENSKLKLKLKQIKNFLDFEFYGGNEWAKKNILEILEK